MMLIDTNIFLSILYGEDKKETAKKIIKENADKFISVITLSEVLASLYKRSPEIASLGKALVEQTVGSEGIFAVTKEVAETAGRLRAKYSNLSLADCIIIATAMLNSCKVASFDPEFKKVEGVEVVS